MARTGGDVNADDEIVAEGLRRNGAVIMGRRMYSGGEGPWAERRERRRLVGRRAALRDAASSC